MEARFELAANIKGAHDVEPVYPQDLGHEAEHLNLVKQSPLPVSAVNVNVKSEPQFLNGALTNPDPSVRGQTVCYLQTATDLAAKLEIWSAFAR